MTDKPDLPDDVPTAPPRPPLKGRMGRFVLEYMVDRCAGHAARRAGYGGRDPKRWGWELLQRPDVRAAIAEAEAELAERTKVSAERILDELAAVAFSDLRHYTVDEEGRVTLSPDAPPTAMRAVSKIKHKIRERVVRGQVVRTHEVEIALWDKNTALRNAGTHLGMFVEKVEHSGEIAGGVLVVPGAVTAEQWSVAARLHQQQLVAATQLHAASTNGNGNGTRPG